MKEVNGEVFIVTKGASIIKLGLVTVYFLTEEQYKNACDINSNDYKIYIEYVKEDSIKNMSNYKQYLKLKKAELDSEKIGAWEGTSIADGLKKNINFTNIRLGTDGTARRYFVQRFVDNLKEEIISDKTNSDAKFKVILKSEKYWVFANAERQISDEREEYYWLFEYAPDGKSLYLSNDNMK